MNSLFIILALFTAPVISEQEFELNARLDQAALAALATFTNPEFLKKQGVQNVEHKFHSCSIKSSKESIEGLMNVEIISKWKVAADVKTPLGKDRMKFDLIVTSSSGKVTIEQKLSEPNFVFDHYRVVIECTENGKSSKVAMRSEIAIEGRRPFVVGLASRIALKRIRRSLEANFTPSVPDSGAPPY